MENGARWADVGGLTDLSLQWFLAHGAKLRRHAGEEIVLDVDSTEDPTHGRQQLALFHGKYNTYMYHPLLIFEGGTGHLLSAKLRRGTASDGEGLLGELRRLVPRLRRSFPRAAIRFRADAGFAVPRLYRYLEREGIGYVIGIPHHKAFRRFSAPVLARARRRFEATGEPVRLFSSFLYRARSWPRRRRILIKVEVSSQGTNIRCVVTDRPGRAEDLFSIHNRRGEVENRIDELKNDLKTTSGWID